MADDLDLKVFIRETLLDIVEGIKEAQEDPEIGKYISPLGLGTHDIAKSRYVIHSNKITTSVVEFDVAVTASRQNSQGGRGGIKVLAVEAGLRADRETIKST